MRVQEFMSTGAAEVPTGRIIFKEGRFAFSQDERYLNKRNIKHVLWVITC